MGTGFCFHRKKEYGKYYKCRNYSGTKLRIYKQNLNSHWQGEEMREINKSIEEMELHLRRTLEKLEELERKYNKELEAREAGEGLL